MTSPPAERCRIIELPKVPDDRGNLTFIEGGVHVPFGIKRVYWLFDVPGGAVRGEHAYTTLQEFVIAVSGSFDVVVDDGTSKKTFSLNRSFLGLYVPSMTWRQMENFSTNAVCVVLASEPYSERYYLRNYDEFIRRTKEGGR